MKNLDALKQNGDVIWNIANLLRGPYRPPQYRRVIPGASIPSGEKIATEDEARLLYVAMTRATKELLVLESEAA